MYITRLSNEPNSCPVSPRFELRSDVPDQKVVSSNLGDTGQLLGSFDRRIYIYICIYNTIHMYSGITSGRVLNGELLYTKILEVNLFAFACRLFRRDFSPLDGTYCMGTHSFLQLYMYFVLIREGFMNG